MPRGRRSKKQDKTKLNIQVAVLMLISVLLAILIYKKSGYIGEYLSPILGGIMGWIKYIIPIGTFAMAVFIAKEEEQSDFSKKILQYAILLLSISIVITIIHAYRGEIYWHHSRWGITDQGLQAAHDLHGQSDVHGKWLLGDNVHCAYISFV